MIPELGVVLALLVIFVGIPVAFKIRARVRSANEVSGTPPLDFPADSRSPQPLTPPVRDAAGERPAEHGEPAAIRGDTAIRWIANSAVLLVAGIAAIVSFLHISALALTYGQGTLAAVLTPLSIDGAVVVASVAMLRAARFGTATPRLARAMLVLAVTATLAANVGYGIPYGVPGALISGWPAVAFIGSVEIAVGMARLLSRSTGRERVVEPLGEHAPEQVEEFSSEQAGEVPAVSPPAPPTGSPVPVSAQQSPRAEREGVESERPPLAPTPASPARRRARRRTGERPSGQQLRALVEQAVEQAGGDPDKVRPSVLAERHGVGKSTVRRHLGQIRAERSPEPSEAVTADAQ